MTNNSDRIFFVAHFPSPLLLAVINILLLVITYLPASANTEGIQCYKCTIIPPPQFRNETKRLCVDFDYSERFIVDCPHSTFCMKKSSTIDLQSKPVNGTERDCAPQMNVVQDYSNGRWQKKIVIEEPYSEGCNEENDKGQRLSKLTYCYCRGPLCNSTPHLVGSLGYVCALTAVIFMLLQW